MLIIFLKNGSIMPPCNLYTGITNSFCMILVKILVSGDRNLFKLCSSRPFTSKPAEEFYCGLHFLPRSLWNKALSDF